MIYLSVPIIVNPKDVVTLRYEKIMKNRVLINTIEVRIGPACLSLLGVKSNLGKSDRYCGQLRCFGELFFHLLVY